MKEKIKFYNLLLAAFLVIIAVFLYLNYNLIINIKLGNIELSSIQNIINTSTTPSFERYGYSDVLKLFNNKLELKLLNINNDMNSKEIVKVDVEYEGNVYSLNNFINDIKKSGNFYSIENIKISNTLEGKNLITLTINFLMNK